MPQRNPELEPKPFVLVSIPGEGPRRSNPPTHERFFGLTGKMELALTVFSEYLFVGSGAYEFNPNHGGKQPDVWYTFFRRNGEIAIPGTSIKGAIRAIVEAISNSCVSQYKRNREKTERNHEPCRGWETLCPACRLFGTTGFGGRVSFSDALPDARLQGAIKPKVVKIGELWEPEKSKGQQLYTTRRFYQVKKVPPIADQAPRPNFRFVEAVGKGAIFTTTLHFENCSEAELGLLGYALGWVPGKEKKFAWAFTPKLGGAKPRCFGAVRFVPTQIVVWENALSLPSKMTGEEAKDFLTRCMGKAREELLNEKSWKELAVGLKPKDEEFCPREGY